jgi:phosphoglucomutase
MPANNFNFRNKKGTMIPMYVGTTDEVYSSDIGRIVFRATTVNQVSLCCTDSDGLSTTPIAGFIAAVPTATTRGTTTPAVPIYIYKLDPQLELEAKYTTANGGGHPASSDLGKYIGFYISTTTVTGLQLDMTYCSQNPGTSNALWFQISGYSTNRRVVYGYPVAASSCLWL